MKNNLVIRLGLVVVLSTVMFLTQPTSAQNLSYAPELTPNPFNTPKLHWRITNVTSEAVEFGFGSNQFWHARIGQALTFDIQEIANDEVSGIFTIGNLTIPANNSRIAAETVFSIWPWFPGLVSHLDWNTVDQQATDAAATFFMNGSLDIQTTSVTKSYIYHQGPWGNQNTTLVYNLRSGILLSAYTEFFFLKDYHLGIEFMILTQNPTSLTTMLFVAFFVIAIIIVAFGFVIARLQPKKR
jgi:hypothetical protein